MAPSYNAMSPKKMPPPRNDPALDRQGATAFFVLPSPVGPLTVVASERGLQRLIFGAHPPEFGREEPLQPIVRKTAQQLGEYFDATRQTFSIPLDVHGTPFQQSVWRLLQGIPFGETSTYGALARALGDAGKSRAVGRANGANPVAIVVPCHRVVGGSGRLTGFSGGLEAKAFLLRLEQRQTTLFPSGVSEPPE